MSSPEPFEPTPDRAEAAAFEDVQPEENAIVGWAKAIIGGIGDTARDMLDEGRRGAREGMDQAWARFDKKTKNRRRS